MLVTTPPAGARPHCEPQSPAAPEAAGTALGGAGGVRGGAGRRAPGPPQAAPGGLERDPTASALRRVQSKPLGASHPRSWHSESPTLSAQCRDPRGTCLLADGSHQFYRATPCRDGSSRRFIHRSERAARERAGGGDEKEEGRWLLFLFYY